MNGYGGDCLDCGKCVTGVERVGELEREARFGRVSTILGGGKSQCCVAIG